MIRIRQMLIKDKQAFSESGGMMRLIGKPVDVAKKWKEEGVEMIHAIDTDAQKGLPTNLDVYDNLTFFINVEVECAPVPEIITKLLCLKCRVVLPQSAGPLVSGMAEKKLLVAKLPPGMKADEGELGYFHDVILEDADKGSVEYCAKLGLRVIIYEKDAKKANPKKIWGIISTS